MTLREAVTKILDLPVRIDQKANLIGWLVMVSFQSWNGLGKVHWKTIERKKAEFRDIGINPVDVEI